VDAEHAANVLLRRMVGGRRHRGGGEMMGGLAGRAFGGIRVCMEVLGFGLSGLRLRGNYLEWASHPAVFRHIFMKHTC
jgi:predicted lipid-binding transport protein (Tim44 family)